MRKITTRQQKNIPLQQHQTHNIQKSPHQFRLPRNSHKSPQTISQCRANAIKPHRQTVRHNDKQIHPADSTIPQSSPLPKETKKHRQQQKFDKYAYICGRQHIFYHRITGANEETNVSVVRTSV
ncbi:MAG: hypothetical protein LBH04_12260 [Tannerellaceae bacterium]|nr:hypothetical protein [Tannerellaceae bacterium]